MERLLTLDLARRLLAVAGSNHIPVKVHPSISSGGTDRHWKGSKLIGVKNSCFVVRPFNGHGKDEEAPEGSVKLCQSKLSPTIKKILSQLEGTARIAKSDTSFTLESAISSAIYPVIDAALEHTLPEDIMATATVEAPITEPAGTKEDFRKKLEEFKQLKQSITTEGLAQLKKLFDDLTAAKEFVHSIETDIGNITAELMQFEVKIPTELQLKSKR